MVAGHRRKCAATLAGISPELYEAASMDGANRFQKMMIQSLIAVLCNLGMMVALCAIGILR